MEKSLKELETLLSNYKIMKIELENLKLREIEEKIDLSIEIEKRAARIARIDNAIEALSPKHKLIIKERFLEGMGKQSWRLISNVLFLSERRCYQIKNEALNILMEVL